MENEYSFRKGTSADVRQFQKLGLESYGQFRTILPEEGWKKMEATCGDEQTYVNLLKIADSFVCDYKGEVIGMAFLIPSGNPVAFFEAGWAYIRLVGVANGHEGKGIGKQLTLLCIEQAKKNGEKTLTLHTSEFQNAARHIYENIGFTKLRELDPIYGKRYWLYSMNLEKEPITYHTATAEDLDILVDARIAFTVELTGEKNEEAIQELGKRSRLFFTEALRTQTSLWIIAKHGATPAGIGGMMFRENPPNFINPSGKWAYLVNMYTYPSFRRKGVCSILMKALEKEAEKQGITAFELHATKAGEFVYVQEGFKLHHEPTYRKYIH